MEIPSPVSGKVVALSVNGGDSVTQDDPVAEIEARWFRTRNKASRVCASFSTRITITPGPDPRFSCSSDLLPHQKPQACTLVQPSGRLPELESI